MGERKWTYRMCMNVINICNSLAIFYKECVFLQSLTILPLYRPPDPAGGGAKAYNTYSATSRSCSGAFVSQTDRAYGL